MGWFSLKLWEVLYWTLNIPETEGKESPCTKFRGFLISEQWFGPWLVDCRWVNKILEGSWILIHFYKRGDLVSLQSLILTMLTVEIIIARCSHIVTTHKVRMYCSDITLVQEDSSWCVVFTLWHWTYHPWLNIFPADSSSISWCRHCRTHGSVVIAARVMQVNKLNIVSTLKLFIGCMVCAGRSHLSMSFYAGIKMSAVLILFSIKTFVCLHGIGPIKLLLIAKLS